MAVTVNTTERRVSVSISRGPKGAPFTFEDFTPEQLDDLKLRFADLTEADKEELKLKFSDLTPEEKEELSLKWEDLTQEQKLELKGEKGDAFTFEDFTAAQLASLKGEKGDPFTYEDFTQEQKDEVFNAFLSNFYDPSIVALSSRGNNEGATFEVKLNKIQDMIPTDSPTPSLLMLPSGVKAGKLYSILPEDGSGDFTVDRNSVKTRYNQNGELENVPVNVPAIDFSHGNAAVSVDRESSNLVVPSDNSAPFTKVGVTSPDDIQIIEDNLNGGKGSFLNLNNITIGNTYTYSVLAKYNGRNLQLLFGGGDTQNGVYANFDLQNGVVSRDPFEMASIRKVGDWWRCSIKAVSTVTSSFGLIFNPITTLQADRSALYQGDGVSGFYLKHFQLEPGEGVTSYIPTTGSIVTRLADNIFQTFPKTGDAVITFSDGTIQTINGIEGETFTLPEWVIKKVEML